MIIKELNYMTYFQCFFSPFLSCADDDNASSTSADNSYCESRISTALASKAMFNSNSMTPPLTVKSIEILALTLCTSYECLQLAQASHQYGPASNGRSLESGREMSSNRPTRYGMGPKSVSLSGKTF